MRPPADSRHLLVTHWHGERPYALTVLAVAAERLAEAEERAHAVLGGRRLPDSWQGAGPLVRERLVRECRSIPVEGLWHLTDEGAGAEAGSRLLEQTAQEWEFGREPIAEEALPGLRALARLSATACRMPPDIPLAADEDLLDVYDQYTIG